MSSKESKLEIIPPFLIPVINNPRYSEVRREKKGTLETGYFVPHYETAISNNGHPFIKVNPEVIVSPLQPYLEATALSNLALANITLRREALDFLQSAGTINVPVVSAERAVLQDKTSANDEVYLFFTLDDLELFLLNYDSIPSRTLQKLATEQPGLFFYIESIVSELSDVFYTAHKKPSLGLKAPQKTDAHTLSFIHRINARCHKLADFFIDLIYTVPAELQYRATLAHEEKHKEYFSRGEFYFFYFLAVNRSLGDKEPPNIERPRHQVKVFEELGCSREEILEGTNLLEQSQLLLLKLSQLLGEFRMYRDEGFKKSSLQTELEKIFQKGNNVTPETRYIMSKLLLLFADDFLSHYTHPSEANLESIFSLEFLFQKGLDKNQAVLQLSEKIITQLERVIRDPAKLLTTIQSKEFERWIDWHLQAKNGELRQKFIQKIYSLY